VGTKKKVMPVQLRHDEPKRLGYSAGMKCCLLLAAAALVSGCATRPLPPAEPLGRVASGDTSAVFMQFPRGQKPAAKLNAPSAGVLTQRGKCLGVVGSDGRFATLYWPSTARIEADGLGLAVVDTGGGGRVRLGEYFVFTGGPVPRGTRFPLGETPLECALWPGYDGWLAIVNPGFRAEPAPAAARGHLPIARGFYVARPKRCDEGGGLFRYDGEGIAWLSGGPELAALYPIRRVREEEGRWVATISAPGPGTHGAADPRDVQVFITPQPSGSVMVEAFGRQDMRLCNADELPGWARDHAPA
jgi:hypothetical protein